MIPDVEMLARAMLRAVEEVIIPALPPGNTFALENANLVLQGVNQILRRGDENFGVALLELELELRKLRDLRSVLPSSAVPLGSLEDEAELIVTLPIPALKRVVDLRRQLRMECETLFHLGLGDNSSEVRLRVARWGLEVANDESQIPQMFKAEC